MLKTLIVASSRPNVGLLRKFKVSRDTLRKVFRELVTLLLLTGDFISNFSQVQLQIINSNLNDHCKQRPLKTLIIIIAALHIRKLTQADVSPNCSPIEIAKSQN